MYRRCGKRVLDVCIASLALVVLSPLAVAVSVVVRVFIGSPVFFRQRRPGFNGDLFELVKFRTMTDARDSEGVLLPDADRLRAVGLALRRLSLDELPQLWNVLRGEMSLVGPRPLLEHYLPLYSEEQMRRHRCRPGITGLAQVNGRNNAPWNEKFAMDNWYCENSSLLLDARILLRTVAVVVAGSGVAQDGQVTVELFRGEYAETKVRS